MTVRFYVDPATEQPHIYGHAVLEGEVEDVLARPMEDRAGPGSVFVITAYKLGEKTRKALRRRQRPSVRKKP